MKKDCFHNKFNHKNKKKLVTDQGKISSSIDYDKEMKIREESQIVKKQYLRGW